MATNFSSIPVLDYSLLSDPSTKPQFIAQLHNALVNVGFYYLTNHPVPEEDIEAVVAYAPKFFDLPAEEKERIRMIHSPHFFGYSRFGAELTKGKVDQREQFDFGTSSEIRWKEGDPEFMRLWGPSQVRYPRVASRSPVLPVMAMIVAGRRSPSRIQGYLHPICR